MWFLGCGVKLGWFQWISCLSDVLCNASGDVHRARVQRNHVFILEAQKMPFITRLTESDGDNGKIFDHDSDDSVYFWMFATFSTPGMVCLFVSTLVLSALPLPADLPVRLDRFLRRQKIQLVSIAFGETEARSATLLPLIRPLQNLAARGRTLAACVATFQNPFDAIPARRGSRWCCAKSPPQISSPWTAVDMG